MRTRLHKQARVNTCAVASLRTALDLQLGINVAEAALEAHATTALDPILKHGTGTRELRAMVQGVNRTHNTGKPWRLRVHAYGSIEDLARETVEGRIPLVRLYEPDVCSQYHMIVVLHVTETHVLIFDPDPETDPTPIWISHDEFLADWYGDAVYTWYAVVNAD